jgi:hypothetical protein
LPNLPCPTVIATTNRKSKGPSKVRGGTVAETEHRVQIGSAACSDVKAAKCKHPTTKPPEVHLSDGVGPIRPAQSVDGHEYLTGFGMIGREVVKPQVGLGQLVSLVLEGEVRQGKEGRDDPGGLG